ncbi:MAG: HAD family phosphatase [Bacteroidetes bacterium]|nr:HAD family phosphatase [Bacteroidota bacterium]
MQSKYIKNIILDLGVVIINIDSDRTVQAMKNLGFENFEKSYTLFKQVDLFDKLEKGQITPDEFRSKLREQLPNHVSDENIDRAWSAMLLDFPKSRIDFIQELGKKYTLYLLSNTNEIHYRQYIRDFKQTFGFEFNSLFKKTYYSHQVGMRKPEPEIYEYLIRDSGINPQESLFVDDLQVNLQEAEKTGIQTQWINPENGNDIVTTLHGF